MKSITLLDLKKTSMPPSSFNHIEITLSLCVTALTKAHSTESRHIFIHKTRCAGQKMMQVKYRSGRGATGPSFPSSGGAVKISISPFQTLTHALAEMYGLVLSSGKVHASFNRTQKRLWAHAEKFSSFYFYTPEEHLYWERVHLTSSLLSRSRCK
jgi:hypothetical protein